MYPPKNLITIGEKLWTISGNPDDKSQSSIEVYINPLNNLPTSTGFQAEVAQESVVPIPLLSLSTEEIINPILTPSMTCSGSTEATIPSTYRLIGGITGFDQRSVFDNENVVISDVGMHHVSKFCSAYFASFDPNFESTKIEVAPICLSYIAGLDKISPHQFAQVFKEAKKKNPDIISYDEAMLDYTNLKDWLTAALNEIQLTEEKTYLDDCICNKALSPSTWVFNYKRDSADKITKCKPSFESEMGKHVSIYVSLSMLMTKLENGTRSIEES